MKRILVGSLFVAVLLAGMFGALNTPTASAHAANVATTSQATTPQNGYGCGNVSVWAISYPVRCVWSTVVVDYGPYYWAGQCIVLDSNPYGAYTYHVYYYGWSYYDAQGRYYYSWYANGKAGPRVIVGSYAWITCDD